MAVNELYTLLGEDDLSFSLLKKRTQLEESKAALTLEQFHMWQKAQVNIYLRTKFIPLGSFPVDDGESSKWKFQGNSSI